MSKAEHFNLKDTKDWEPQDEAPSSSQILELEE